MKRSVLLLGLCVAFFGLPAQAQFNRIGDNEKSKIQRELERQISRDTNENVRVTIVTADFYSLGNQESGVRGRAYAEGVRGRRTDITYDSVMDARRERVLRVTWNPDRNSGNYDNNNFQRDQNLQPGALTSGRYEIQLVATRRLLSLGNNSAVIQGDARNSRRQQWDIEDAGNGYYFVRSAETGELLSFDGRGDNGSSIILTNSRRTQDDQMWQIVPGPDNGYYFIARNGRSIDSPSSARYEGGRLQLYGRNGEANQRFLLRRVGDNGYNGGYNGRNNDRSNDQYNRDRADRGASSGRLSWRGRVDGQVELQITGGRVFERVVTGQAVFGANAQFNGLLPRRDVTVSVDRRRGRGRVDVIEQPSARNNYRAVIRIDDSDRGADDYELEISWY